VVGTDVVWSALVRARWMFVLAAPTASLFDTTVTFEKHGGKKLLVVHDRYPVAGSARQRVAKQAVGMGPRESPCICDRIRAGQTASWATAAIN
jgi:hypothetical protein